MHITGYVSEGDWNALIQAARGGFDANAKVFIRPLQSTETPCQISLDLDEHGSAGMFIREQNQNGIVVEYHPSKGFSMA